MWLCICTYLCTILSTIYIIITNAEVEYHSAHYWEKMHINKLDDDDNIVPVSLSPDIDRRSQVN